MADLVYTGQTPGAVLGQKEIPSNVDWTIYKGDFYETFIELRDSTNTIVDVSGLGARAQLRENYDSAVVIELETTIMPNGQIRIYMSSAMTSQLNADKSYIWDFQTERVNGDVKTWLTGDVTVLDEVTR